ncbi:hypothetical protein KVV02_008198 [Mortierella alpina]|uniref:HTH CENPB-type domain-containing protein n=1 Tax=Mortierella alpina TaxID=64518 RepID=A0A9P7ZZ13_MORAP|nr:hypothetical protein KVV02_008198 [Mortierella alpina]
MSVLRHQWDQRTAHLGKFQTITDRLLGMVEGSIGRHRPQGQSCYRYRAWRIQVQVWAWLLREKFVANEPSVSHYFIFWRLQCRSLGYVVLGVNEFYTSKRSPQSKNFVAQVTLCRLFYKECRTYIHRDVMANNNMANIVQSIWRTSGTPIICSQWTRMALCFGPKAAPAPAATPASSGTSSSSCSSSQKRKPTPLAMNGNPQSEDAPEIQARSHDHPGIPFLIDILRTPAGYSSGAEGRLQAWEYDQLSSEMKQFMEQLELPPCESDTAAASWKALMQQPIEISSSSSASSCGPNNHTSGSQPLIPGTFNPLPQSNSGMEHVDEASLPLSLELLPSYSNMLADLGHSTMPGLEYSFAKRSQESIQQSFGLQQPSLLGSRADSVHHPQQLQTLDFIQQNEVEQQQLRQYPFWPTENINEQQSLYFQGSGNHQILQSDSMNQSENIAHIRALHTMPGFASQQLESHTQQLAQGMWPQQGTQVVMQLEGHQSIKDLTDGEMSPWERVEQESSDWSEWEQISAEHSDRSDWEQVSVEHSDKSDWEQSATDLESPTSASTSEQEEASAAIIASKEKRGRTNISHQRKLEIIAFCNANKNLTSDQQSKELGVVRTTMINILSQQKQILMRPTTINALTLQKEILKPSTTVASSRLHIMDLLLCAWIKEVRDQYIPVPDAKVRWQAFAVHRMLSGLTNEPLPPCAFSNSWMEKFKVRMALKMEKMDPLIFVNNDSDEVKELRQLLPRYELEDIYTCDVTSIFALPGCVLKHPKKACTLLSISKNKKKKGSDCVMGPGVSLLLLCNGTGSRRQEPVMLDRLQQYAPGNFGSQVNSAEDVRRVTFRDWLTTFDQKVQRESLLLISEDTWEQIRGKLSGLRHIKVAVVPKHLNAWLPMRTGIAREFKSHINAINFERTLDPERFSEGDIYSMAMHDIDSSVIRECFKRFSAAAHWSKKNKPRDTKSPDRLTKRGRAKKADSAVILTGAQERLKSVFLSAHKDAKTKEHVLLYYLNQDSDIGPSAFLCTMIERMHRRPDVEPYLNPSGLGTRKESWWSHVVITSQTP